MLGFFNGHVGRHVDLFGNVHGSVWCRSEKAGRKNIARFIWRHNYMFQLHGFRERKVTF